MKWMAAFMGAAMMLASGVGASEAPTVEMGRKLFESPVLGSSGKSCSTCHPAGKGLEEIAAYTDDQLKEMINFCIRDALRGRMLDLESQEIESLFLYLRKLGA